MCSQTEDVYTVGNGILDVKNNKIEKANGLNNQKMYDYSSGYALT